MKIWGEYKFFATDEEARAYMKELDEKGILYGWYGNEHSLVAEDFETDEDYQSWLEEEDRYTLAAIDAGLTEEEKEAKPNCVWLHSDEFNEFMRNRMKN